MREQKLIPIITTSAPPLSYHSWSKNGRKFMGPAVWNGWERYHPIVLLPSPHGSIFDEAPARIPSD